MAGGIKFSLREQGRKETIQKFEGAKKAYRKGAKILMFRIVSILEAAIINNIRTLLTVRSGALMGSVADQGEVKETPGSIIGIVQSRGVPYAAIHEFGGTIKQHFVKPRVKKALKFTKGGNTFFSKGHFVGPTTMRARRYMGRAIDAHKQDVQDRFSILLDNVASEFNTKG